MTEIWLAFALYSAAAIALGWRAARSADRGDAIWTAGRSLTASQVGVSISAGFMSVSWSCVYASQLYYWYGLGAVWLITIPWIAALYGIHRLASRYHGLEAFSQPEMVGQRFGSGPQRIVALSLAFVFLVWGGAEIYVAANLLSPSMAVSRPLLILLIGLVVATYSALGGLHAVVHTDRLQYALVALYIALVGWLAVHGLMRADSAPSAATGSGATTSGALSALLRADLRGAKSAQPWWHPLAPGLPLILMTTVAYLPGWLFETDLWLRIQAAESPAAARRGVRIAALNSLLFVGLLPALIGVAALALFPVVDGAFPSQLGTEGDAIFAALVTAYAPPWLGLVVAIGLVAAAMSTIDTCTNVMALSIARDLPAASRRDAEHAETENDAKRRASSATVGPRARRASVLAVGAACLFALFTDSLWDIFYLSSGILTTAVAYPVAAVFLPAVRPQSVLWSSASGLAATAGAYFAESRGLLGVIEPDWMAASGVGFILWGAAAAVAGALLGQWSLRR